MTESNSSISSRLPWITLIIVIIAFGTLYLQQSNTDKINQYRIKILQEKLDAHEDTINQLATINDDGTVVAGAQVSSKDPAAASISGLQTEITQTQRNLQDLKLQLQGIQNDYDGRFKAVDTFGGRIDGVHSRMQELETEVASLKQLIRQ